MCNECPTRKRLELDRAQLSEILYAEYEQTRPVIRSALEWRDIYRRSSAHKWSAEEARLRLALADALDTFLAKQERNK